MDLNNFPFRTSKTSELVVEKFLMHTDFFGVNNEKRNKHLFSFFRQIENVRFTKKFTLLARSLDVLMSNLFSFKSA